MAVKSIEKQLIIFFILYLLNLLNFIIINHNLEKDSGLEPKIIIQLDKPYCICWKKEFKVYWQDDFAKNDFHTSRLSFI